MAVLSASKLMPNRFAMLQPESPSTTPSVLAVHRALNDAVVALPVDVEDTDVLVLEKV